MREAFRADEMEAGRWLLQETTEKLDDARTCAPAAMAGEIEGQSAGPGAGGPEPQRMALRLPSLPGLPAVHPQPPPGAVPIGPAPAARPGLLPHDPEHDCDH
jgi:hypothetical protein